MGNLTSGVVVIGTGQGGVPQQVAGSSGAGGQIVLRAKKTNVNPMYVGPQGSGPNTLSALNGLELDPGDFPITFPAVQGAGLYVVGSVGDALTWALIDP